jgi:hypothetical protein
MPNMFVTKRVRAQHGLLPVFFALALEDAEQLSVTVVGELKRDETGTQAFISSIQVALNLVFITAENDTDLRMK